MGVSLSFKAYSGKESSEFQKHYKSVKFCIENELSFPIETVNFFKGKIDCGDLDDYEREYLLEMIKDGVEVPMRHTNLNFTEIRIKVSDIPASVDELVINQKYKNERGR